jgi:hypothetical protein
VTPRFPAGSTPQARCRFLDGLNRPHSCFGSPSGRLNPLGSKLPPEPLPVSPPSGSARSPFAPRRRFTGGGRHRAPCRVVVTGSPALGRGIMGRKWVSSARPAEFRARSAVSGRRRG